MKTAGTLLVIAVLAPLVGVQVAYRAVRRRRIHAQDRRLRIEQAVREAHVMATAVGIVADAYAVYGDLYDTPHQPHPGRIPT